MCWKTKVKFQVMTSAKKLLECQSLESQWNKLPLLLQKTKSQKNRKFLNYICFSNSNVYHSKEILATSKVIRAEYGSFNFDFKYFTGAIKCIYNTYPVNFNPLVKKIIYLPIQKRKDFTKFNIHQLSSIVIF